MTSGAHDATHGSAQSGKRVDAQVKNAVNATPIDQSPRRVEFQAPILEERDRSEIIRWATERSSLDAHIELGMIRLDAPVAITSSPEGGLGATIHVR